jgi:hypothetical protein
MLFIDGELNEYLHKVDEQCNARLDILMKQMKPFAGITAELKVIEVGKANKYCTAYSRRDCPE